MYTKWWIFLKVLYLEISYIIDSPEVKWASLLIKRRKEDLLSGLEPSVNYKSSIHAWIGYPTLSSANYQ
jgi:hypothetical protein